MPAFDYESQYWAKGSVVAGVDEVGRGCLAGPVVSSAVIINHTAIDFDFIKEIDDSKKLSPKKRDALAGLIAENFINNVAFIDNDVVDEINILQAAILSMDLSVSGLSQNPDHLLIDGNRFKKYHIPYSLIVKGDSISYSIAAASILAKVSRDKYVIEVMDSEYPEYGFASHKGYASAKHIQNLQKYGPCKYHRKSFLKKIFSNQQNLF